MSEELLQRGLDKKPEKIGKWDFYNIGATTINQLKKHNIIRDINYGKIGQKKVDGIIINQKKVIAIIENKTSEEFNTPKKQQKAIRQELEVAKKLECPILIATDTKETIWINVKTSELILNENDIPVSYNWNPTEINQDTKLSILIEKIYSSIDENNNKIIPKEFVNPTDLAKQVWQDLWSVSGASPEQCLYTFVELFIFKYLSDLKVLKTINSFDFLMDMYKEDNTNDEVLQYYADTIRKKIKGLFPENQEDGTTIINGTIFVSKDQKSVAGYSTVFKKILEEFKKYGKLENINYDFKSQLFESFLKESISKKNWGQFFTPLKVIKAIQKMATNEIKEGMTICDPACGVGKFLLEPIKSKLNSFYEITKDDVIPKITVRGFDKGFDKDEQKTIILAKANMLIYFSELIRDNSHLTQKFAKIFNDTFTLKTNSILGTLSEPIFNEYDLILTNPPYVTSGSSNLKEEISKNSELKNYYKTNAMGVEGLFMEWVVNALKANGKAFVVVPDGIFNRQNDKRLRNFIKDECFIDSIISLPLNTFFTTNKKTYILALTKKDEIPHTGGQNKKEIQTHPIFTYLVSEIGESRDIYRFNIEQNDLEEAVILFNMFKGAKEDFKTSDKRCKMIKFENFDNWIIDNSWTKEEKIELGVIKKEEKIKFEELPFLLDDISNNILSFKEEIQALSEKKKSKKKSKEFLISDVFNIFRGEVISKNYINDNKGKYPVFSSSGKNNGVFGHINSFNFDCKGITWAIDGYAGKTFYRNGRFSMTNLCGLLTLKETFKNNKINLEYVSQILEPILREKAKGRKGENGQSEFTKVYPSMIKNVRISLPVKYNKIDLYTQDKIIERIKLTEELKTRVKEYKDYIKNINIEIENNFKYKEIKINDIFIIKKGLSKYTNKHIQENNGEYPLYSSATVNDGIIGYIDSYDYNLKCITWTTDGIHAGTVFLRDNKFSMTTHCGALILNDDTDNLLLKYIMFYLKNNLKEYAIGEQNKRVTVNIIKNVLVKIPINLKNEFDIHIQQEISNKYQVIENIKISIEKELTKIENLLIEY